MARSSSSKNSGDRYSLDDLVTLYKLEPELRDILVEGPTDRGFYSWYVREISPGLQTQIYAIDDRVEVPAQEDDDLDGGTGCRARVLRAMSFLESELGESQRSVTGIVDSDFSRLIGPMPVARKSVIMTDAPSLEGYILQDGPFEKLVYAGLDLPKQWTAKTVLDGIRPVLKDIYSARAVTFAFGLRWPKKLARYVSVSGSTASFDAHKFVTAAWNGTSVEKRTLVPTIEELVVWSGELQEKVLNFQPSGLVDMTARGHDIAEVLRIFVPSSVNEEAIELAMRAALTVVDLKDFDLHRALTERLK